MLHAIGSDECAAILQARAAARERAWALGGRRGRIVLDFDGHLLEVHSEEGGAPRRIAHGIN